MAVLVMLQDFHFPQGFKYHTSCRRQGKFGGPLEQFHIQFLFKLFDILAQALLGYKTPFVGFGKIHFFHRQQEQFLHGFQAITPFEILAEQADNHRCQQSGKSHYVLSNAKCF